MATDPQGFSGRTEPGPDNQPITRPAYRITSGQLQPAGVAGMGGSGSRALLDLSTVSGWRLVAVVLALFYIGVFHLTISPRGVGGGVRL
jgi:hypothetical protein